MNRKRWIFGTFLGALLSAVSLFAQPVPEAPPPEAFGASLDVRAVNVEAVVTDSRGNRVEGLTAGDFRLLVDGREVPVDYFTEVRNGEAAAAASTAPAAPEGAAPAPPVPPGGAGVGYLVFIDESFTIAADRDALLISLEKDLRLGPDDRMAIVAYNGGSLDLLSGWTGDAGALRGVLRSARDRPANGIAALVKRRQEDADAGFSDFPGQRFLNTPYYDAQAAAEAAGAAMRAIPPAEGRKVLFLISGGWPTLSPRLIPTGSRFSFDGTFGLGPILAAGPLAEVDPVSRRPLADTRVLIQRPADLFEAVTGTANLLGYTIYPLNGPSHEASWSDVADVAPRHLDGMISTLWEEEVRDASGFMTRETGGKVVSNTFRRSAFLQVAEDVRSYYWLGFSPEWKADGRSHDIRVEARRPGLRVRSRQGFADLTREAQDTLATESLLLFGGGPETRRIEIEAGTPKRAGLGRIELPLTLVIPAEALTASAAEGGGYELRARLAVSNLDRWGGKANLLDTPLRLTLSAPPRPGDLARYKTTVQVRRIQQKLTFAVQDETGGGGARGQLDYRP